MLKFLSLLVGTLLLLPVAQVWAEGVVYNRILVKINENIITQYDLDEEMQPIMQQIGDRRLSDNEKVQLANLRKKALDKMVNDILIQQEVNKFGIEITEEVLDKEISRVKGERQMNDEEFEAAVAKDGLSMDDFRVRLKEMLQKHELISHMVNKKVLVTDSEIEKEYGSRKDEYTLEKLVEVGMLLLPSDVSAVEVRTRIMDGELTFAEAVEKYSIGPGKDSGGSIGEMNYSDLAFDWKEAIADVKVGGVSEPLMIQGQEALLSPIQISKDRLVPLEEVRDNLYQELMDQKRDKIFTDYFDQLKEKSVIVYMNGVS